MSQTGLNDVGCGEAPAREVDDLRSLQRQLQNYPNLIDLQCTQLLQQGTPCVPNIVVADPRDIGDVNPRSNGNAADTKPDNFFPADSARRLQSRGPCLERNAFVVLAILQVVDNTFYGCRFIAPA